MPAELSSSSKLETLLKDLERLETITNETLLLVKAVLSSEPAIASSKRTPSTKSKVKSVVAPKKADATTTARNALKIIKVCLTTLKMQTPVNNGRVGVIPSSVGKPTSRGKLPQSRDANKPLLAAQVCLCALESWTQALGPSTDAKRKMDIILVRSNFVSRLLDRQLMDLCQSQMRSLHQSIHERLGNEHYEPGTERNTVNLLLYPAGLVSSDLSSLISTSQLQVIRYIHESQEAAQTDLCIAIRSPDGPLEHCRRMQNAQPGCADKQLEYLHRAFFGLAARDIQAQLELQLLAIDCLCAQKNADLLAAAKMIVKCIPAVGDKQVLDHAETLAERFMLISDMEGRLRLVMCERMVLLMRQNGAAERAQSWADRTMETGGSTGPSLTGIVEALYLKLTAPSRPEAQTELVEAAIAQLDTAPLHEPEGEIGTLLKTISALRKSLMVAVQVHTGLAAQSLDLFCALLQVMQSQQASVCQADNGVAVVTQLIDASTTCAVQIGKGSNRLPVQELARLLSFATAFSIDSVKPRICTQCWNIGGVLFNQGDLSAASELLALASQWSTISQDPKKLQFLWSCYLQLHDYHSSSMWLLESLSIFATTSFLVELAAAVQMADFAEVCFQYPDLCKVLQKLTFSDVKSAQFSLANRFEASSYLPLVELYFYQLWLQRKACASYATVYRRASDRVLASAQQENLTRHDIRQHISLAMVWALELQDKPWWLSLQNLYVDQVTQTCFRTSFVTFRAEACKVFKSYDAPNEVKTLLEIAELWASQACSRKKVALHQVEEACDMLAQLKELCVNQEQPHHAFHCLKLLSRLNDSFPGHSTVTQLFDLETALVDTSLECGHVSEALAGLRRARKLVARQVNPGSVLRTLLCQAAVEISTGTPAPSMLVELDNAYTALALAEQSKWTFAVLHVMTEVMAAQGHLGAAIQYALEALSVLRKVLARAKRKEGRLVATEDDPLTDAMQHLTVSDGFEMNQARQLSKLMLRLALLHGQCGFVRDATYYAQQALELAQASGISLLRFRIQSFLSLLQARVGKVPEVIADVPILQGTVLDIQSLVHLAEVLCLQEQHDAAHAILKQCTTLINATRLSESNSTTPMHGSNGLAKARKVGQSQSELDGVVASLAVHAAKLSRVIDVSNISTTLSPPSTSDGDRSVVDVDERYATIHSLLVADPVYGGLHDSALSLPSVCTSTGQIKTSGRKAKPAAQAAKSALALEEIRALVQSSKALVAGDFEETLANGESFEAHQRGTLFASLNLIHSAIVVGSDPIIRPIACTFFLESSRAVSVVRELERKHHQPRPLPIGSELVSSQSNLLQNELPGKEGFLAKYVDIIPESWSVVSIGMGVNQADLIVSRLQANRTPLILRLPLARHHSRDMDEETFEFETAKQELRDIVQESNQSAQAAKDIHGKKAKQDWWDLRKSLDERLKMLLSNMERCWLGGFRGLLGRSRRDTAAFDQFKTSFAKIMLAYVPFRSSRSFDIDTRILDLFVDLGKIDDEELLELLEDLLYFILDIYQFHGEAIAYDEIDIDQMTVDIQTALNVFHERASLDLADGHTILILDKEVSMFPWESMSCLRSCSVSRVPSLAALKAMLGKHGSQSVVSRSGGRFVLNPSQDLLQTEKAFSTALEDLPDWQGVTASTPTETVLLDFVANSSIYLYFGHGGGEQYARASKLKQLPRAALAILMGCSSGALKDQGVYDSWGTPYNYLVAGAPAVLANLWDVTDKDIDRFSQKALTLWGLFGQTDTKRSPVKGKRGRPSRESSSDETNLSLSMSVARSRDECVMPYLNGAAPVLYGLPARLSSE